MRLSVCLFAVALGGFLLGCETPSYDPTDSWTAPPLVSPPAFTASTPPLQTLPMTLVEAESGRASGTWPTASTARYTAGAEASGRRYVELGPGEALELVAPVAADSLVVRYSYPDDASGQGREGRLMVAVGDRAALALNVTSRYSWEYGTPAWGGTDVWNQPPSAGKPRHFWDEANVRLPGFEAGTTILITNPRSQGQTVLVDLVEFETVPEAVAAPDGSVNFASYSPAADGTTDDTAKLQQAIHAAAGGTLYLPEGTYRIGSVEVGAVTLQGAGPWRTRFVGPESRFRFTGQTARIAGLAVFGETDVRNDLSDVGNAFSGQPGPNSAIERVWVEHKKCAFWVGVWMNATGPSGLTIRECRFRNLMADAVNLCSGTRDSVVEGCLVRNTGDDALAAWSPVAGGPSGGNNTFRDNFIQSPWVASGIALYGGGPFVVEGNTVWDTVTTGSGLYVSSNFGAHPFTGTVDLKNNLLVRSGAHESDPGGSTGAIRVLAGDNDMSGATITFSNNTVVDPLESAVSLQGPYSLGSLVFSGLNITNAPWAADVKSSAKGSAEFSGVSLTGSTSGWRNSSTSFTLTHP